MSYKIPRLRKLIISLSVCFLVLASLSTGNAVWATSDDSQQNDETPLRDAKWAALYHVLTESRMEKSGWKGSTPTLSAGTELYDMTGTLMGHLFDVYIDGRPSGYVVVGADLDEFPILEFSYKAQAVRASDIATAKSKTKKPIKHERLMYAGAHRFYLEAQYSDDTKSIVDLHTGEEMVPAVDVHKVKENKVEAARAFRSQIASTMASAPTDGVTPDPRTFEDITKESRIQIVGVPAWDQWQYYFDSLNRPYWTGCSPTAAADIMGYWEQEGYSNMGHINMVFDLRTAMHTTNSYDSSCNCFPGGTAVGNISPGMQSYARGRGYSTATAGYQRNPTYGTLTVEVSTLHPSLISFDAQTRYGEHTVSLIGVVEYIYNGSSLGHQYMIIHDDQGNGGGAEMYVAYGRNYRGLHIHTFKPE